jgi:signal transduction histidine kinase
MSEIVRELRAAELARATFVLQESLGRLAASPELNCFIGQMLATIERHAEARCAILLLRNEATVTLRMRWATVRGDVIDLGSDPLFAVWQRDIPEDLTPAFRLMCEQPELILEPQAGDPYVWPFSLPWHEAIGNRSVICVALQAGEQYLGFLGVGFDRPRAALGESTITLARGMAQQATLALELTRLSEQARQTAVAEERNRLARDLHDTLAQGFAGISVQLETAKRVLSRNPEKAATCINEALGLARAGLGEVRRSVWALRPLELEGGDLTNALRQLVARVGHDPGVHLAFETRGPRARLPPEAENELLRIAQEALTNSLRHAHPRTVTVELSFGADGARLMISDDGHGFTPAASTETRGFGLISMRERAARIGATVTIHSERGRGTVVTVDLSASFSPSTGPP